MSGNEVLVVWKVRGATMLPSGAAVARLPGEEDVMLLSTARKLASCGFVEIVDTESCDREIVEVIEDDPEPPDDAVPPNESH